MFELSWDKPYEIQRVTFVPVGDRYAEIDAEDYAIVSRFKWRLLRGAIIYAVHTYRNHGKCCALLMHRLVVNIPEYAFTDHRNHDGLDNRKSNLREATFSQNMQNRRTWNTPKASRFKGVSKNSGKWRARIRLNKKEIFIGNFNTEEEAAIAYNQAAKQYFGEFACTVENE